MSVGYFLQPAGKALHIIAGERHDYHDETAPFTVRALCGAEIEMAAHRKPPDTAYLGKTTCLPCEDGAKKIQDHPAGAPA